MRKLLPWSIAVLACLALVAAPAAAEEEPVTLVGMVACAKCVLEIARAAGRLRDECLNETLFSSLREARDVLKEWREDYNCTRPHSALGNLTPSEFAEKITVDRVAA